MTAISPSPTRMTTWPPFRSIVVCRVRACGDLPRFEGRCQASSLQHTSAGRTQSASQGPRGVRSLAHAIAAQRCCPHRTSCTRSESQALTRFQSATFYSYPSQPLLTRNASRSFLRPSHPQHHLCRSRMRNICFLEMRPDGQPFMSGSSTRLGARRPPWPNVRSGEGSRANGLGWPNPQLAPFYARHNHFTSSIPRHARRRDRPSLAVSWILP